MMSPKTKLIVGGVGAAAVTSSVVMSSVALTNQGTSTVQEEKKTTEVTREEFDELKTSINSLDAKINKAVQDAIAKLPPSKSDVTKEQLETIQSEIKQLKEKVKALEDNNKPASDEATNQVSREEFEAKVSEINKLNEDIKRINGELNKSIPKVSEDQEFKNLQNQLNTLTDYVDNKHAEYKRDLEEKTEAIKQEVRGELNEKLEEIKKILEETKKIEKRIKELEQMADPEQSNQYMQTLATHAQEQRAEIMKQITDLKNKFNDDLIKLKAQIAAIKK